MSRPSQLKAGQRGVAVIMALLLTTLAITIVASLFWQQQVQVRLIENQRLQLQKQWILRGALDWASLILREDAKYSSVDTLDEPWSAPLAETRLDQYVENGKADADIADTTLAGGIEDAQARFNLSSLASNGNIDTQAVTTFSQLLSLLHIDANLAQNTAQQIAASTPKMIQSNTNNAPLQAALGDTARGKFNAPDLARYAAIAAAQTTNSVSNATTPTLGYQQIDDLLAIAGWTPALLSQIKPYVIFLPRSTPINVNTASATVIAATLSLTVAEADTLLITRQHAYFRDLADLSNRLPGNRFINASKISVNSNYFLITGKVHMNRARLDMQALLERNGAITTLLWLREY